MKIRTGEIVDKNKDKNVVSSVKLSKGTRVGTLKLTVNGEEQDSVPIRGLGGGSSTVIGGSVDTQALWDAINKKVDVDFFKNLFTVYDSSDIEIATNTYTRKPDNLKISVGTWTEEYLSALGKNSEGGSGGGVGTVIGIALGTGTTPIYPDDDTGIVTLPAYPTKVSQLVNDSGFVTSSTLNNYVTSSYLANNFYTKAQADSKYMTIAAFESLFNALDSNGDKINHPYSSGVDSIKALVGLWTEEYLSALGQNGEGGGGGTGTVTAIEVAPNVYRDPDDDGIIHMIGDVVTSTERTEWNAAAANSHTHSNKAALDTIDASKIANWNNVATIMTPDGTPTISRWPEVVSFLSGYTTSDSLSSLLANKVDVRFFNSIFTVYDDNGNAIVPNTYTQVADNLKILVGTWTEQYLSALGKNSEGGSGTGDVSHIKISSNPDVYLDPVEGVIDMSSYAATWNSKQNAITDLATIRSNASHGNTAYSWGNHANAGYALASNTVSNVAYNTTSKKLTKTINGNTTDIVTAAAIVTDGGGAKASTTITAGNGLTGGGDLSSNRTINVVSANAAITVNADNIKLNVINDYTTTTNNTIIPLAAARGKDLNDRLAILESWFEEDADGNIKTKDMPNGTHRGFYTESFVSALGLNSEGGGGGTGDVSHIKIGTNPDVFLDPDEDGIIDMSSYAANWNDAYNKRHTHSNKSVLDGITSTKVSHWDAVYGVVPSAAYESGNSLADKNFVNSSISTSTATFRGTNTTATTESAFLTWANGITHDLNDYVFWSTKDSAGNTIYKRYKYDGSQWVFEYDLNNSSFTSDQWSAINSGITSTHVSKLNGIASGAQVNVIESVKVNGNALSISSKAVDITAVPLSIITGADDLKAIEGLSGTGFLKRTGNNTWALDTTVVLSTRKVSTGNGLQGGGDLSADRTISILLPTNSGLSVASTGLKLDIVNNLTTASDYRAISATQAKKIWDLLNQMFTLEGAGTTASPYVIKANYGLYTEQFLSALGQNSEGGGGGDFSEEQMWAALQANTGTYENAKINWNHIPLATTSTAGAIKVGSTLAISNGILNQATIPNLTADVYTKVTVDSYGRVTQGGYLLADDIPSLSWSKITSDKPTTLLGYGIANAYTKAETDSAITTAVGRYLPLTGGTMTGNITMGKNAIVFSNARDDSWNVGSNAGIKLLNATGGVTYEGAYSNYAIGLSVSGYYKFQIAAKTDGSVGVRYNNGDWSTLLNSSNYDSYLPFFNSSTAHATKTSVIYAPTSAGTSGHILVSGGANTAPSFRALQASDIPNLSWNKITSDKPTTLAGYGITDAIKAYDPLMPTNIFSGDAGKFYLEPVMDCMWAANKRFVTSVTITDANQNVTTVDGASLFNGDYSGTSNIKAGDGNTIKIRIQANGDVETGYIIGYFQGYLIVNFYYYGLPKSISGRLYYGAANAKTWKNIEFSKQKGVSSLKPIYIAETGVLSNVSIVEISIECQTLERDPYMTMVSEVEWWKTRATIDQYPLVTKYSPQTLYYPLTTTSRIYIGDTLSAGATTLRSTLSVGTNATIGNALTVNGHSYFNNHIVIKNSTNIAMKDTNGTALQVMIMNGGNQLDIGYQVAHYGYSTLLQGNDITLKYGQSHTEGLKLTSSGVVNIAGATNIAGLLSANGNVKTTKLYLYKPNADDTNAVYLEYNSTNSGVHIVGAGLYSDSYVSALGANSSGGGGGDTSLNAVWGSLTTYNDEYKDEVIDVHHIPNLSWSKITINKPTTLSGYGILDAYTKTQADAKYATISSLSDYATQTWVNQQGFVKSSGVTSVATGSGLTGGTITSTGTISIVSGFSSWANALGTWGTLKTANGYTSALQWKSSDGGEMSFAYKGGQISAQLDGYFYQNEGAYRVVDTSDLASGKSWGMSITGSAAKLGTSNVGNNERPIYLNGGVPTAVNYVHAQYIYGGLNTLGNTRRFLGVDPAFNYNAYAVEQGAVVKFYLDGVEIVRTDDYYAKSLFDGKPAAGAQPFDMANQSTYGAYNSSKSYIVGELCSYTPSGATKEMWYRCLSPCSGIAPTNTTYWEDVSASGTYRGLNPSKFTSFKIVVTNLPVSIAYENGLILFWRVKGQNPNYVTVSKLDSNGNAFLVVENQRLIGPSDPIYLGTAANTGVQNGISLEFTGFTQTNYWNFALSQIAFTGLSGSLNNTVLFRAGGNVYGGITPYTTNTIALGTSSQRWSTVYTTALNLNGAITGATTGAFSSNVTIGGTLGVSGNTTVGNFMTASVTNSMLILNKPQEASNWTALRLSKNGSWSGSNANTKTYIEFTDATSNSHVVASIGASYTGSIGYLTFGDFFKNGYAGSGEVLRIDADKVSIPSGKTLKIGDCTIEWDAPNQMLKFDKGIYSEGAVSALGSNDEGGGSSDFSEELMWAALQSNTGTYANAKIDANHIPDTSSLYGYLKSSSLSGYVNAVSTSGSGNAVTSVTKSGNTITFTKGSTFLTSHQTINALTLKADGTAVTTYTPNSAAASLDFVAGSNISLTRGTNQITIANTYSYTLPLAASGTRGGVQIGYSETNSGTSTTRNYAVKLSSEKMYVNVPWTDTTYKLTLNGTTNGASGGTSLGSFYAPTSVGTDGYVLKSSGSGAPSWVAQSTLSVGDSAKLNGQAASYYATASRATTLEGYFTNGVANTAAKLNTGTTTYTAWGQTYWSSGVPQSISGNMTSVGSITPSANGNALGTTSARFNIYGTAGNFSGNVSITGTLGVTGATTLTGLLTANGGIVVPSAKTIKIGDCTISWDSTNSMLKFDTGIYSTGAVSALGSNSSGGGSGTFDEEAMWTALGTTSTAKVIASSHIPNLSASKITSDTFASARIPVATASAVGGIKVGTTLAISDGVLNQKSGIATAGTYKSVTVDTYGRVTAGTNPTTLAGYGITDAKIASGTITLGSNTITPLTSSSSLAWGKLTGTPTTLSGYGITNAYTKTQVDNALSGYLPLSGGTLTGGLEVGGTLYTKGAAHMIKFDSDTSRALAYGWWDTNSNTVASIVYHNTAQNIILNPIGSSNTWSDAVGKYSLIVGNNSLTYNTYPILHSNNYSSYALPLSGGTMTGTLTTPKIRINTRHSSNNKTGGIYYYDGTTDYLLIGQGSANLWIGANETAGTHHTGDTYISAGSGNAYISRLVNNTRNAYLILDSGNYSSYALPLSGGKMTGPLTWKNATALSGVTSTSYVLCIDGFADGGTTHYITTANLSVGSATKATQDGSGRTITSTYLPLSGGTLTGTLYTIGIINKGGTATPIRTRGLEGGTTAGDAENLFINNNHNGNVYICNGGGNVGIGNTSPSQKLHVSGNILASGEVTASSDERLKTIVGDGNLDLKYIANAPNILFKWNNGQDEKVHGGSLAQYFLHGAKHFVLGNDKDYYSLNYGALATSMAISIAKEVVKHDDEITRLKKEVVKQAKEIVSLKNKVNELEERRVA